MSLIEAKLYRIVTKQYIMKLKAHIGVFVTLSAAQIIAILFSLGGVSSSSTSAMGMSINVNHYSGNLIIAFTLMWAAIIAMQLTSNKHRDSDFAFVSNRITSTLTNGAFLLTSSIAAGISAMLCGVLLKVMVYFIFGNSISLVGNFLLTPFEITTSMIATILYVLLISSFGYFIGMLIQLNKSFIIILPVMLFGILILQASSQNLNSIVTRSIEFFGQESSLTIFILKMMITIVVVWSFTLFMSNRIEVRR